MQFKLPTIVALMAASVSAAPGAPWFAREASPAIMTAPPAMASSMIAMAVSGGILAASGTGTAAVAIATGADAAAAKAKAGKGAKKSSKSKGNGKNDKTVIDETVIIINN